MKHFMTATKRGGALGAPPVSAELMNPAPQDQAKFARGRRGV